MIREVTRYGGDEFIAVRPVTETDAAVVCMICCEDLGYQCDKTLVKLRISQLDTEREAVFVAIFEDRIVGFIHVERYNTLYFETMANILGLAVSSKVRKHGIGKALDVTCQIDLYGLVRRGAELVKVRLRIDLQDLID